MVIVVVVVVVVVIVFLCDCFGMVIYVVYGYYDFWIVWVEFDFGVQMLYVYVYQMGVCFVVVILYLFEEYFV